MSPKWSQNRKKNGQRPKIAPDGAQEWSGSMSLAPFGPFLASLWSPKIDPKRDLGRKWGHRNRLFIDFSAFPVFPAFLLDFSPIFNEKSMFFPLLFSMSSCFFCNLATLTIVRILQVQTRFFTFSNLQENSKNVRKNR